MAQAASSTLDESARSAILDREVEKYVRRGYRVVSRTNTTAQLVKPKVFSRVWAFLWFCVLFVGLLAYLLWYAAKRDQTVYLSVDEQGQIQVNGRAGPAQREPFGTQWLAVAGGGVLLIVLVLAIAANSGKPKATDASPSSAAISADSSADEEAETHLANAKDYRANGQLGLALVELDQAISMAPRLPEAAGLWTEIRAAATTEARAAATANALPAISILSHSASVDRINYHHIVGEVRNNSSQPARFVKVVATFYDDGGGVVGTDSSYVRTSQNTLGAGATGPFHIISANNPRFKTYKLQIQL